MERNYIIVGIILLLAVLFWKNRKQTEGYQMYVPITHDHGKLGFTYYSGRVDGPSRTHIYPYNPNNFLYKDKYPYQFETPLRKTGETECDPQCIANSEEPEKYLLDQVPLIDNDALFDEIQGIAKKKGDTIPDITTGDGSIPAPVGRVTAAACSQVPSCGWSGCKDKFRSHPVTGRYMIDLNKM